MSLLDIIVAVNGYDERCPLMLVCCTMSAVRVCVAEGDCAGVGDVGMAEITK